MMAWTFMSAYFVIAVLLSVGGAIGVFMIALNKRIAPDVLLFYAVAAAGALGYFIGSRDLNGTTPADLFDSAETWSSRFANLFALGICMVAIVQIGIRGPVSRSAVLMAMGALQYYFICFLFPVTFDPWFVFDHRLLYPLFSLAIIMMPMSMPVASLARHLARAATVVSVLSIVLIFVKYDAAVLTSYESVLPFFKGRLYGATPHPNILGPASAFAILLLSAFPPKRRVEFYFLLAINLVTLVLSQSKTSWITLIISQTILHLPRIRYFRLTMPSWVYVVGFVVAAAVPAALTVVDKSIYDYWSGNFTVRHLGTLTGRTDIWQATLLLVKQHSLITGPGYATYVGYMQSLFPNLIPNPHNLYLATMVQAGIVGLVSLAVYLTILAFAAANLDGRDRLFGFAYIALVVVRGMSESFSFQSAFTAPNFWALLMFMRLLGVMAAERKAAMTPEPVRVPFRLRTS